MPFLEDTRSVAALARFKAEGPQGLADRSSRPRRCPLALTPQEQRQLEELRRQRWPLWRIAQQARRGMGTVSRYMKRLGLSRLKLLQPPEPVVRFVTLVAPEYKLAPQLVLAVMATESNFDPLAVSPKNAQGLMQLMPGTAARFKVRQIQDPVQNIRGGMAYLRWLLAYFEGDLSLVLAAYNAGEGAVDRYRGVPPYAETRDYVPKVLAAWQVAQGLCVSRAGPGRAHPDQSAPSLPVHR